MQPLLSELSSCCGKHQTQPQLNPLGLSLAVCVQVSYYRANSDAAPGGYDPRLQDNVDTLKELLDLASAASVPYFITSPHPLPLSNIHPSTASSPTTASILLVLNFTTLQRTALLHAHSTRALLYTPAHEHFGIVPIEGMAAHLPVLACDSGGPTESVLASPPSAPDERTGWLVPPDPALWADALLEIVSLDEEERRELGERARRRAETMFGMEAMAEGIQDALYEAMSMGEPAGLPVRDITLAVVISLLAYLTYWVLL